MWAKGREDCNWCSAAELVMRLGEEGRIKVFSWLSYFHDLLNQCVPSECLLVLDAGIMGQVAGRKVGEEDLSNHLGRGSERKGKLRVFCCRAGDGTGGTELGEQKESCVSASSLLEALREDMIGLVGGVCCDWGLWQRDDCGEGVSEGDYLWNSQDMETRRKGKLPLVFC